MKQKLANGLRWITASRGLPLVALAVLGLVTVMPGWVSAQSETTTAFTSPLPVGHHGEHGGPNDALRELLDSIIDRDEILADALGITAEELAAAKEAGTSIDELITEAGLTKETVRTEIQNAITDAVEQAVSDGTLTQEQADLILTPPALPQHDGQPGPGHHRGPGDGGHDPQATPTPTLIATAPADGTPVATTTAEATPTAEASTAGAATTNGAGDNGNRPRPHHDQPPAQNSDTGSTSSSASTASTSSDSTNSDTAGSTSADTSANNEQPASDRPERGGHQRPGR